MKDVLSNMCKKINCTQFSIDIEELSKARRLLEIKQYQEIFQRLNTPSQLVEITEKEQNVLDKIEEKASSINICEQWSEEQSMSCNAIDLLCDYQLEGEGEGEEKEYIQEMKPCSAIQVASECCWKGDFHGFEILTEAREPGIHGNKKCIQLAYNDSEERLETLLSADIRCFIIDLAMGTGKDMQELILRLRKSEYKISRYIGFPITTTIIAKLSSRYQYTGYLEPPDAIFQLKEGDKIILNTNRDYSMRGSASQIYVNARFLIVDLQECDFLLIGPDLQLRVQQLENGAVHCIVAEGGELKSHMPVLFPSRCARQSISIEELEDITFAREAGIDVIVLDTFGTKPYLDNIQECLMLLKCDELRLFTRVTINQLKGCDCEALKWVVEKYDGFIIDIVYPEVAESDEILHICPAAVDFLKQVFDSHKPYLFQPGSIADKKLIVHPDNYLHFFYYPDKYIFQSSAESSSFYFSILQDSQFDALSAVEFCQEPFCDESQTGSNSLARFCVAASKEMHAAVIFVCSFTGRMAMKIAYHRPKVPIILLSALKSASDLLMLYHNVHMLDCSKFPKESHRAAIYRQLLFGLIYANARKLIKNGQNVICVYNQNKGTTLPDKYVGYKYNEQHFAEQLCKVIL